MRKFWHPRREDDVERLLRENRAEPRDEFVASLLSRLVPQERRLRPQRLGRRVLVAAAVTALAAGAGVAAGGTQVAGTSISNLVHVADGNSSQPANGSADTRASNRGNSPGDQQYTVEICHHTGSATNPWVDLFLSPEGAANHLTHHPLDYAVGAPGNPTTCPP
jgi:hypothetical protein